MADECDDEARFWNRLVAEEEGPFTTNFDQLVARGVTLPEPDAMDDTTLTAKLWEVIKHLAEIGVVLESTDHLSDRELYSRLWTDSLRDEVPDLEPDDDTTWHVDLVGCGSEEDVRLYLKYYADDDVRESWIADFPDYDMPPREKPPYDRDRQLNALYEGSGSEH